MLTAFMAAFRTPDLRRKLFFTLGIVVLFRVGANLPSPGVSVSNINECIDQASRGENQDFYSLLNLFSGGALLQLAVFALGVMPYITASIILQLLTVVIPRLEQLKKEGKTGQNKITQYTRYLTIGLALLQAGGIIALANNNQLFPNCRADDGGPLPILSDSSIFTLGTMLITMTAGTAVIMWLGELITDRGVGNGMSVLILTSIAARIPAEGNNILRNAGGFVFVVVCFLGFAIIAAVVFMEQAQRRIPVQYAKRMVGRRMFGGTSTYLPMKINQAGVIPVIFGSSLLYIPQLLTQFSGDETGTFRRFIENYVNNQASWVHISLFFLLIVFFTYFYVGITFNPEERADEMKKYGGFIPGIRPGRPTTEYLTYVSNRLLIIGSLYLGFIAVLPNFFLDITGTGANQNFPFGGTAVLIMVGVGLDTVKQIESQLMQRNYEGFLR